MKRLWCEWRHVMHMKEKKNVTETAISSQKEKKNQQYKSYGF